jgi:hypothetical protein
VVVAEAMPEVMATEPVADAAPAAAE